MTQRARQARALVTFSTGDTPTKQQDHISRMTKVAGSHPFNQGPTSLRHRRTCVRVIEAYLLRLRGLGDNDAVTAPERTEHNVVVTEHAYHFHQAEFNDGINALWTNHRRCLTA